MASRRLDFADHRRELGNNRYIYAVVSRRARGLSIGINLNPDKVCNFDCPYCQVDRSTPGGSARINLGELESELRHLLTLVQRGQLWTTPPFDTAAPEHRRVADIAFAGDGEPTTPAAFPEAAAIVRKVRDDFAAAVPIRLLTNATMLHRERVKRGLAQIDEAWCKLDAGTAEYFALVDGTTFPFSRVLKNLAELAASRPITIQSMFLALDGAGPTKSEIDAWVQRLCEIGGTIAQVQVYTVARKPADPRISPLDPARLAQIGSAAAAAGFATVVV